MGRIGLSIPGGFKKGSTQARVHCSFANGARKLVLICRHVEREPMPGSVLGKRGGRLAATPRNPHNPDDCRLHFGLALKALRKVPLLLGIQFIARLQNCMLNQTGVPPALPEDPYLPIDLELDIKNKPLYWTRRGNLDGGNSLNRVRIGDSQLGNHEVLATGLQEGRHR
jgi:hypothetical protein